MIKSKDICNSLGIPEESRSMLALKVMKEIAIAAKDHDLIAELEGKFGNDALFYETAEASDLILKVFSKTHPDLQTISNYLATEISKDEVVRKSFGYNDNDADEILTSLKYDFFKEISSSIDSHSCQLIRNHLGVLVSNIAYMSQSKYGLTESDISSLKKSVLSSDIISKSSHHSSLMTTASVFKGLSGYIDSLSIGESVDLNDVANAINNDSYSITKQDLVELAKIKDKVEDCVSKLGRKGKQIANERMKFFKEDFYAVNSVCISEFLSKVYKGFREDSFHNDMNTSLTHAVSRGLLDRVDKDMLTAYMVEVDTEYYHQHVSASLREVESRDVSAISNSVMNQKLLDAFLNAMSDDEIHKDILIQESKVMGYEVCL